MKAITPLAILLISIIITAFPAQAVTVQTCACVGWGCSCNNENVAPTIDEILKNNEISGEGNCIGNKLIIDLSVIASDVNGVEDLNYAIVKLYKVKPSTGELIWLNETHLTSFTPNNGNTGIFSGTLLYEGKLPGSYVLKVEVFDDSGVSDSEQVNLLTIMILGDFSGDGCVDVYDITYLARHIVRLQGYEDVYSAEVSTYPDPEGVLDAYDITYLARAIVRLSGYTI